eukprot:g5601.t1
MKHVKVVVNVCPSPSKLPRLTKRSRRNGGWGGVGGDTVVVKDHVYNKILLDNNFTTKKFKNEEYGEFFKSGALSKKEKEELKGGINSIYKKIDANVFCKKLVSIPSNITSSRSHEHKLAVYHQQGDEKDFFVNIMVSTHNGTVTDKITKLISYNDTPSLRIENVWFIMCQKTSLRYAFQQERRFFQMLNAGSID